MTALNPTIVKAIKANGLLKEGHFAYRSGQHSHWLIDMPGVFLPALLMAVLAVPAVRDRLTWK